MIISFLGQDPIVNGSVSGHCWVNIGSVRRCSRCLMGWEQGARAECSGIPERIVDLLQAAASGGNQMVAGYLTDREEGSHRGAGEAQPIWVCSACGAWSTTGTRRKHKLQVKCQAPTRAGQEVLRRLQRALAPKPGMRPPLCTLLPAAPLALAAAAAST